MISWFQHPLMFKPYNFDNVEALPADNKEEENKMSSTSKKVQPTVEGFHFRTGEVYICRSYWVPSTDQWVIFYDWIRAKGLKVFSE